MYLRFASSNCGWSNVHGSGSFLSIRGMLSERSGRLNISTSRQNLSMFFLVFKSVFVLWSNYEFF